MEWRVLVQCTAPALQWRPAGAPTVSLGGLPVEGTPLWVRTQTQNPGRGFLISVRGLGQARMGPVVPESEC